MAIEFIHTYLVHPNKNVEEPAAVIGSLVPHEGEMFELLASVYEKADQECNIGIAFNKSAQGDQVNVCRELLVSYAAAPEIEPGRLVAQRLSELTTKRSGLGLLFLIKGTEGDRHKLVISRFRANNGVLVTEGADMLTVEFINRVFMKNASSYKAVVYQHQSLAGGFWQGMAVDKQINSQDLDSSDYWVKEFLLSDFVTSPALGTRRLAVALKNAISKSDDLAVKSQITAAATLAAGLAGQTLNVADFCNRYNFSPESRAAVLKALGHANLASDNFTFDGDEFKKQLPYRTVELNTGAMLTAPAEKFDELFNQEDAAAEGIRFSTIGTITGQKLEKTK